MLKPADLRPEDLGELASIIPDREPELEISIKRIPVSEPGLGSRIIPVCEPRLGGNEKKYVLDCVESNWISSAGKYIPLFEQEFSRRCGAKYGVACCNGTVALHLALATLGIGAIAAPLAGAYGIAQAAGVQFPWETATLILVGNELSPILRPSFLPR